MSTFADQRQVTLPTEAVVDAGSRKVKVITDVHLGHTHPDDFPILCALLTRWATLAGSAAPHVAILGDFVDLLLSPDDEFDSARYAPIWAALAKLAEDRRLTFVVGNHDIRLRDELFGYPKPAWPTAARLDGLALGGYRDKLQGKPFTTKLSIGLGNSFHRYAVIRTGGSHWLLCHGDEVNYGHDCRLLLGGKNSHYWRDLEYLLWRLMDATPALVPAVGADLAAAVTVILQRAFARATAGMSLRTEGVRGMVPAAAFTEWPLDDPEVADAFGQALLDGLQQFTTEPLYAMAGPAEPEAMVRMASVSDLLRLRVECSLPEARAATTLPDAQDFPAGGGPPQTLELAGLVIGHRHQEQSRPFDDAGVPLVIDAGSWEKGVKPPWRRSTVTTLDGARASTDYGAKEL